MAKAKTSTTQKQRLFVPELGTHIILSEAWSVELQREGRNDKMIKDHGNKITFPAGSELIFDRIYIRAGSKDYSSITFRSPNAPKGRFWVKLAVANQIVFTLANARKTLYRVTDTQAEITRYNKGYMEAGTRSAMAKKMTEGSYHAGDFTFFDAFSSVIVPEIVKGGHWQLKADADPKQLNIWDIEPVNKTPYITKGETHRHRGFGSFGAYASRDYYNEHKARADFMKEFFARLKKKTGAKNMAELLDHLPSRFKYEVIEEIV